MKERVEEYTIKVTPETMEILREVKKNQGIYFKFAMEHAIKTVYGKKNSR